MTEAVFIVELDALLENRRASLALFKISQRRRWVLCVMAVAVLLCLWPVLSANFEPIEKLWRSLIVVLAVPFLIWFFVARKYSMMFGGSGDMHHMLVGKTREFSYVFTETGVEETVEGRIKLYPYSGFITHKAGLGEDLFVFKDGLIYLPKIGMKKGRLSDFRSQLEGHVGM